METGLAQLTDQRSFFVNSGISHGLSLSLIYPISQILTYSAVGTMMKQTCVESHDHILSEVFSKHTLQV